MKCTFLDKLIVATFDALRVKERFEDKKVRVPLLFKKFIFYSHQEELYFSHVTATYCLFETLSSIEQEAMR